MNKRTQREFRGPLFIIGMPRSGTKLLRDLLNQHPAIAILNVETDFLPYLVQNFEKYDSLNVLENFYIFYKKITKLPFFTYMTERGRLPSAVDWHNACPDFTPQGVFEGLISVCMDITDADVIWGDKSPSYINHVYLIRTLYPEARFVHIVRDVRDYALSIRKAWGKNMFRAAQRWADSIEAFGRQVDSFRNDVLELRYEDLTSSPETELRKICDFLCMSFDKRLLELTQASENIGDTKGRSEIVPTNVSKYKAQLDKKTIAKIERLAGPVLQLYGYTISVPCSRKRLGLLENRFYQFLDGINLVRSEMRNRGFIGSVIFFGRHHIVTRV